MLETAGFPNMFGSSSGTDMYGSFTPGGNGGIGTAGFGGGAAANAGGMNVNTTAPLRGAASLVIVLMGMEPTPRR